MSRKGIQNSLSIDARRVIESTGDGYDPLKEQIAMSRNLNLAPEIRLQALEYVCKRMYPTLKAVEIQVEADIQSTIKTKNKIEITPEFLDRAEEIYRAICSKNE